MAYNGLRSASPPGSSSRNRVVQPRQLRADAYRFANSLRICTYTKYTRNSFTIPTPADNLWSPPFAERLKAANMALTPTLTLWEFEYKGSNPDELKKGMGKAAEQLKAFSRAGGQILFGTDLGYIQRFATSEEYVWMSRAGMNFQQILASLTTNPARRFGYSTRRGRIAKGMDADLTVLRVDPAEDSTAFSKVRYTIVGGKIIYSQK